MSSTVEEVLSSTEIQWHHEFAGMTDEEIKQKILAFIPSEEVCGSSAINSASVGGSGCVCFASFCNG